MDSMIDGVRRGLLALALLVALVPPARAQVEVGGVKYPTTMEVGGRTLQLNGAGIRHRFVVKVYTAGLYLQGKAATAEAALAAAGPKRLHVVMLREIDANDLGRLFTRGMQDNASRDEFARSIPGTLRMADIFSARKKLKAGDSFGVDWLPGQGTLVLVNGQPQGDAIREPEFFGALLRIWLGNAPADAQLKEALLGKAVSNVGGSPGQQ